MNYRLITFAIILFTIGQGMVWIQVNGPLIWPWAKKYKLLLLLFGIPITYLFMEATRMAVSGFEGSRNCLNTKLLMYPCLASPKTVASSSPSISGGV